MLFTIVAVVLFGVMVPSVFFGWCLVSSTPLTPAAERLLVGWLKAIMALGAVMVGGAALAMGSFLCLEASPITGRWVVCLTFVGQALYQVPRHLLYGERG